jgi:hypothetical protein
VGQLWDRLSAELLLVDMDERESRLRPVALPAVFRAALFAAVSAPAASTKDDEAALERILFEPFNAAAEAAATEAQCRRLHMEAMAVSIAAVHLHDGPDGGRDAATREERAARAALVLDIAQRAVGALTGPAALGLRAAPGGDGAGGAAARGAGAEPDGMDLDADGGDGAAGGAAGAGVEVLRRVAPVLPPRDERAPSHRQRVADLLATLTDFSAEWAFDAAALAQTPRLRRLAPACVAGNQAAALSDLAALATSAYSRFLQAAASTHPRATIRALNAGSGGSGGAPARLAVAPLGAGAGAPAPLHRLLLAIAARLTVKVSARPTPRAPRPAPRARRAWRFAP